MKRKSNNGATLAWLAELKAKQNNRGYKIGQRVAFEYATGGDDTPEIVHKATGVIISIDKGLDHKDVDGYGYLIDAGDAGTHGVNACNIQAVAE